ncbi:hypothetical protein bcere0021_8110 [Bacillus cereus Rock3-42]|nr:hypothetical protein bcere0021_8110 [Bacillus cereus Rock3-42]
MFEVNKYVFLIKGSLIVPIFKGIRDSFSMDLVVKKHI